MPDQDFSNDQECTIASVKSVTDSQYGKKVQFSLEGYPNEVSCFTKFPDNMVAGGKIYGHIEVKDGKWHNFKFGKKEGGARGNGTSDGAKNYLEFKVMPILEAMRDDLKAMRKKMIAEEKPEYDETSPHDENGIPF